MSSAEVSILTTRTCRWTLRLSVSLLEKQVPFELINVLENGVKAPWFISTTPFGKTPVLRHRGHHIPESLVICEYIEQAFGGRPLLPLDPVLRAWARIWLRFCDDTLIPALGRIVRAPEGGRDEAVEYLVGEANRLERYFVSNPTYGRYWSGNQLTLQDIGYHTFFEAVNRTGSDVRAALRAGCPGLSGWGQALMETEVFAAAAQELEMLA